MKILHLNLYRKYFDAIFEGTKTIEYRKKTDQDDALVVASGTLDRIKIILAIFNFDFMGGSMGKSVGEGIVQSAKISLNIIKLLCKVN